MMSTGRSVLFDSTSVLFDSTSGGSSVLFEAPFLRAPFLRAALRTGKASSSFKQAARSLEHEMSNDSHVPAIAVQACLNWNSWQLHLPEAQASATHVINVMEALQLHVSWKVHAQASAARWRKPPTVGGLSVGGRGALAFVVTSLTPSFATDCFGCSTFECAVRFLRPVADALCSDGFTSVAVLLTSTVRCRDCCASTAVLLTSTVGCGSCFAFSTANAIRSTSST
mmetsp:Transcript_98677/g.249042  ORF Transcript_98677/g.249042 Transcript_98677/m.249042 type:complete len:226 (+) Transcript_98677:387-1064(+)